MADIILPQVGIVNEVNENSNILVEINGNIHRLPIEKINEENNGYATQTWVESKNYTTQAQIESNNQTMQSWVLTKIREELGVIENGSY